MSALTELRFAARQLRRTPAVTLASIVTLALAIGANTAVFSAVRALLLRPLPFTRADELLHVWETEPGAPFPRMPLSYPDFEDLRDQARSLADVAAWNALDTSRMAFEGGEGPFEVRYGVATTNLFGVLGVEPVVGRRFTADEQRAADGREVMISERLWVRLGGDRRTVGGALRLDGRSYAVVGVLPASFRFGGDRIDVWLPLMLDPEGTGLRSRMSARGARFLGVVARRASGVTPARVEAELATIASRLAREYPGFDAGLGFEAVSLRDQAAEGRRPTLLLLFAAVGCVLLVGCGNLAHLQLVRVTQRGRELALRGALGAGRLRLVRQLFAESALLALVGGALALGVAALSLRLLPLLGGEPESLLAPFLLGAADVRLDPSVLAFTATVAVVAALLFGLAPAWRVSRSAAVALRPGAGITAGRAQRRRTELLVAGQIAVSLVLLTSAGLLVRSLRSLGAVDLGFAPHGVIAVGLRPTPSAYGEAEKRVALLDALLPRLEAVPGVTAAGAVDLPPLSGPPSTTDIRAEGLPEPAPGDEVRVHPVTVTPGARAVLRTRLLRGRDLSPRDRRDAVPVMLVSDGLAHLLWPGQDPIGKRIALSVEALRFHPDGPPTLDFASAYRTVVGVVADVRERGPGVEPLPTLYVPFAQRPPAEMTLLLRTDASPASTARSVAAVLRGLDAAQPLGETIALSDLVADATGTPRLRALLTSLFAGLTLLLACAGLYGVLAHAVATQRKELGVRLALGAARSRIVALVGARAARVLLLGTACGLAIGALAGAGMTRFLHGLGPTDPVSLLGALALLTVAAAAAALLPAWKATRVDPALTMRAD
jgi:putative ABC transport system permease protein